MKTTEIELNFVIHQDSCAKPILCHFPFTFLTTAAITIIQQNWVNYYILRTFANFDLETANHLKLGFLYLFIH